ncbi:MAG TPA: hypothetical protein VHG35_13860 [Gemmatimonadales bacterium]|nr:hypothetical protein [Gemmatimonadales bacterium]
MTGPKPARPIYISTGLPAGLALGACIWLLSATITGRAEPWDAPGMYYPAALLGAGLLGGFLVPAHWGEVAVGVFTGQALVLLGRALSEPGSGGMWPLGLMLLALYSLLALLGAGVGSGLRRLLRRSRA